VPESAVNPDNEGTVRGCDRTTSARLDAGPKARRWRSGAARIAGDGDREPAADGLRLLAAEAADVMPERFLRKGLDAFRY
jgi:hypothetical protein